MKKPDRIPHVVTVEPLDGYMLRLTFDDGVVGDVDLSDLIGKGPMAEPLRDLEYFRSVFVDEECGTIAWPHGLDLAPEVLHEEAAKAPVHS